MGDVSSFMQLWMPAFAGMTIGPSLPRRRESSVRCGFLSHQREHAVVVLGRLKCESAIEFDGVEASALKQAAGLGLRIGAGGWRAPVHFFGDDLLGHD